VSVDAPDLTVTAVSGPAQAQAGTSINVTWTVKNLGPDAAGPWLDRVVLIDGSGAETSLGIFPFSAGLAANGTTTRTQSVILPIGLEGTYTFAVRTDADNSVPERSDANNFLKASQTIQVAKFLAPNLVVATIAPPGDLRSDQEATLRFTVRNLGVTSTGGQGWGDAVFLSRDDQLSGDDVRLATVENQAAL